MVEVNSNATEMTISREGIDSFKKDTICILISCWKRCFRAQRCHEKEADIIHSIQNSMTIANVVLVGFSAAQLALGDKFPKYIIVISLFLTAIIMEYRLHLAEGQYYAKHESSGKDFLRLRNKMELSISDIKNCKHTLEEISEIRDALINEYDDICGNSPRHCKRAYKKAKKEWENDDYYNDFNRCINQ